MKSLASAVVHAVTHFNCGPGTGFDDEDVAALNTIGSMLEKCTEEEKDALSDAADRAFLAEHASAHRMDYMRDYLYWMQDMFGKEVWQLNSRRRREVDGHREEVIAVAREIFGTDLAES